uniref:Uncharacterized protein n=1 Tax=Glossina austeni TaxID=7395 RepID=A0A1A9UD43_GLOAU
MPDFITPFLICVGISNMITLNLSLQSIINIVLTLTSTSSFALGSIEQWRILFGTSSVITIVTYSIYQIYGTATIQKWNYLSTSNSNSSEENNILNNKDTEDNIPIDDV